MLKVHCMGQFYVEDDETGVVLDDAMLKSDMLKKLIVFTCINHDRPISASEYAEALWQTEEVSSPAGALKNLMYRLRKVFKDTFGKENCFVTLSGAYQFNTSYPVWIDCEELVNKVHAARDERDEKKRTEELAEAVDLYTGYFLDNFDDLSWVMTEVTFLHSTYIGAVKELAELYSKAEEYEKNEQLLTRALKFDPYDEELYARLVQVYIKNGKPDLADRCLKSSKKILKDNIGITDSEALRNAERELLSSKSTVSASDLSSISEDMREKEMPTGAYLCSYPAFRELYRLETRKTARLNSTECLLLVSIKDIIQKGKASEKAVEASINRAMDKMEKVLVDTLRIGDVVTRYSNTQYLVLLPKCSEEEASEIWFRVKNIYEAHIAHVMLSVPVEFAVDTEQVPDVRVGKVSVKLN